MKSINIKFVFIAISLICFKGFAQQVPLVSQYFYTPMLYNPAMTGKDGEINIWGISRDQWTGVQGGPTTRGGTVDAGFLKNRLGAGLAVFNDRTDIINRMIIQVSLAGKVKLFKDAYLGIGLTPSLMDVRIDFNRANPEVNTDPHLLNQARSRSTLDLNAGIAFTWKNLAVGFAVPQILNSRAKYLAALNETDFTMSRHFLGHASYKVEFSKKRFFVLPMVLVKYTKNAPVQAEGNLLIGYKNILWLGGGYRSGNGVVALIGVGIKDWVKIGYAFDYHLNNKVTRALGPSHEVALGIRIPYGKHNDEQAAFKKRLSEMDSLSLAQKAKIDSLDKQVANLQKQADEYNKKLKDNQGKVEDLSKMLAAYKANLKERTTINGENANQNLYRLDNVYFETNSSILKQESSVQLDRVVKYLQENPSFKIKVLGHTDYKADDNYNNWLSERRAKSVNDYIASKGIAADRLTYFGLGKKSPIADNSNEEGRAKNRRVEIEIIK